MKKLIYFLIIGVIMASACVKQTKNKAIDKTAAKAELTLCLDKMYNAMNNKDTKELMSCLADDGLFCGTAPEEFQDKATLEKGVTSMFADTTFSPKISIDKREIRLDSTGTSAIVIDQFLMPWSAKIQVRHVIHVLKAGDKWLCDFMSTSFVPKNEDMSKIFEAVK